MISRRKMIAGSVATVAAAYSCSLEALAANQPSSKTRKFTMDLRGSSIGLEGDQRQMVDMAVQHGFESVGADAWFIGGLSDEEIAKLKSDVSEKGLVWGSAGLPVEFRKDETKFQEDLSGLPRRAAALQKAGGTTDATHQQAVSVFAHNEGNARTQCRDRRRQHGTDHGQLALVYRRRDRG